MSRSSTSNNITASSGSADSLGPQPEVLTAASAHLGDAIICPVCLSVFGGRIRQCRAGHSVCQSCFEKLVGCPTCRGSFAGEMRNYALEEVIASLQKTGLMSEASGKAAGGQRAPHLSRRHCKHDRTGLSSAKQPSGLYTCRADPDCQARLPICRLLNHVRQLHEPAFCTSNANLFHSDLPSPPPSHPLPGLTGQAHLPRPAFQMRLTVPLQRSVRRAVHIRRAGVFFICFEALPRAASPPTRPPLVPSSEAGQPAPTHFAWVQSACLEREAHRYQYHCELQFIGGPGSAGRQPQQQLRMTTATFSDAVLGESWLPGDVRAKRNCLAAHVPHQLAKATLRVSIRAADGATAGGPPPPRAGCRNTKTQVVEMMLPAKAWGRRDAQRNASTNRGAVTANE